MSKEQPRPEKTEEPEGPRSFVRMLAGLSEGEAESELSYQLHELVKRMQEEAAARADKVKGGLTLKLRLVVEPRGFVGIGYEVETKAPKRRTSAAVMWVTKGGNLVAENPRQEKLPLREVPAARAEVRDVAPASAAREV